MSFSILLLITISEIRIFFDSQMTGATKSALRISFWKLSYSYLSYLTHPLRKGKMSHLHGRNLKNTMVWDRTVSNVTDSPSHSFPAGINMATHQWQQTDDASQIRQSAQLCLCRHGLSLAWKGTVGLVYLCAGCLYLLPVFYFLFQDRASLCNSLCRPGWPRTHRDLAASASRVLRLKVCTSTRLFSIVTKRKCRG